MLKHLLIILLSVIHEISSNNRLFNKPDDSVCYLPGFSLLSKLGDQWDYFYSEIMPVLHSLLYPIKVPIRNSI